MEMLVELIMPLILYILGSILLVILIILSLKFLKAMNKLNSILEDTYKKTQSLNGFFSVIDTVTDKVALLSDTFSERITDLILNLFRKKAKKKYSKEVETDEER